MLLSSALVVVDSVREGAGKGVIVHWIGKHVVGALPGNEQYVCIQARLQQPRAKGGCINKCRSAPFIIAVPGNS